MIGVDEPLPVSNCFAGRGAMAGCAAYAQLRMGDIRGRRGIDRLVQAAMSSRDLGGWKSRVMVDRYAKFTTEHLKAAAARIERGRDKNVTNLSRSKEAKGRGRTQRFEYLVGRT
jgi:hypothetical protein